MTERASIFDNPDGTDGSIDVSGFKKKTHDEKPHVSQDVIKAIAEGGSFPSREPVAAATTSVLRTRRRKRRSGRDIQLNVKVKQETYDGFWAIANSQNWVLAETLERALDALKVKLAQHA